MATGEFFIGNCPYTIRQLPDRSIKFERESILNHHPPGVSKSEIRAPAANCSPLRAFKTAIIS